MKKTEEGRRAVEIVKTAFKKQELVFNTINEVDKIKENYYDREGPRF